MFGISWIKLVAIGLAAMAIAGVIFAGYRYVTGLEARLVVAEKDAATLSAAKAIQDDTIKRLQSRAQAIADQAARDQTALARLMAESAQRQAKIDRLVALFQKHNLERLSNAKPKLMEDLINRGTATALERLRSASAPHSGDGTGRSP